MTEFILLTTNVILVALVYKSYRLTRKLKKKISVVGKKNEAKIEATYNRLQAYIDLSKLLDLPLGLPSLSGWAAYSDLLLAIAKHTLLHKPENVVECSSGASTLVIAKCLEMNGKGHVYSIENDDLYAKKTQKMINDAGLSHRVTIIVAPLKPMKSMPNYIWYDEDMLPKDVLIDLLVVDGPPGSTCRLARYPALPVFAEMMNKNACVFLDDANRKEEMEIVRRWRDENPNWKGIKLDLVKGTVKLSCYAP